MTLIIKSFEECVEKITYGNKIQKNQYLDKGKFPVVSQELDLVNGYWNIEEDIYKVDKPVIIFGDHTRTLKYVDFNFVLGADGTKIIKPKNFIDSRYFYYFLLANPIEGKGYSRHYKFLKDLKLTVIGLEEQKAIVERLDAIFTEIETAMAAAEANANNAEALFQSYLSNIRAPLASLGKLVTIKTGKLNSNASVENGKYPFFTCSKEIFAINDYAFDCEAVLLAGNNASGDFNVKHYKGKFNAYQRTYVITIDALDKITYRYLYFQLVNALKRLKTMSVGANTKFLKIGMIGDLEFPLPNMEEQLSILKKLSEVEENSDLLRKCYLERFDLTKILKQAILKQAFSGELVKD
jgi:type I restriction enzyme S subunit